MKKRILYGFLVLALLVTNLVWVTAPVSAASPKGNGQNGHMKKITQEQRKAAAKNAAALGFVAGVTSATLVTDPNTGTLIPDYFGAANWAFSPPLTKFVDPLPGLGSGNANALGRYIPVAVPDTTTYPGSDYYEIAVIEYKEQLHSELPPTTLRGYVQLSTSVVPGAQVPLVDAKGSPILMPDGSQAYGVDDPHYLGPAILANGALPGQAGTPVRIKFYNLLPTGTGGNLFIPVDTTVMGAGMGPYGMMPPIGDMNYTQNRADIHLHGNNTVWISDGTPHQWITPANEVTAYPQGVSVQNVPDMPDPGQGAMTVFYSNAQSARLMFYHDHSYGITRLNVYAGEAAPYIITDVVEQDLINGTNNSGVNPNLLKVLPDTEIPLVIQDKTFVDSNTIGITDPTWLDTNQKTFGTNPGTAVDGDLWYPHVYMPAQNPWDISGANAFGRWMYGPWFYPPTANLAVGPIPNPYCLPYPPGQVPGYEGNLDYWDNSAAPHEPPFIPGTPNPSMPGEAFMDTPLVNGAVYPYLDVEPKAYRFRILNAADDRSLNLSLYKASTGIVSSITLVDPGSGYTADPAVTITGVGTGATAVATADLDPTSLTYGKIISVTMNVVGSGYTAVPTVVIDPPTQGGVQATATATIYTDPTEVGMVPVTGTNYLPPFDVSGVPDPTTAGPDWIQIGTEGGFLPAPVVIPAQNIGWNTNPTAFNFGNVNQHSLLLGTAERADVIVDFSNFASQTLILYNDAPAAFPAPDSRYDYYTCDQDQQNTGGAPTTQPGKGPNTRTIMQIRVAPSTPATAYDINALNTVWAKTSSQPGVFATSQEPIIVPQAAYNSAYNNAFTSKPAEEYIQVNKYTKTFTPIDANGTLQPPVTLPIQPKAVHDEMGGVYDTQYGRMSGMLGLELPATTSTLAQFLPYGYASPPVDIVGGSIYGTLVGTLNDGTQIWNISQNGVDTHTIHTHLFNIQLINRVGWDGAMIPPDPNELGWKETIRVNPLEQTFIALRPILPNNQQVPFLDKVPNSIRLIDPTMPEGALLTPPPPAGWFDPNGVAIPSITNHVVNFGWEYVYHCHILAHEEMDMMHDVSFVVPPTSPSNLAFVISGNNKQTKVTLTWIDNSITETSFTVQRATSNNGPWTTLATLPSGSTTYTDPIGNTTVTYYYQVFASNTVGDAATPGFPVMTADSAVAGPVVVAFPPKAPSNLTATLQTGPQALLTWTDNANNETGFVVEKAINGGTFATLTTVGPLNGTGTVNYTDTALIAGNSYSYRVAAINTAGMSGYSNTVTINVPAPPAAPTNLSATLQTGPQALLTWTDNANNETGFVIERGVNGGAFTTLTTMGPRNGTGNVTYADNTLTTGNTYSYRVAAINAAGMSSYTNTATVNVVAPPSTAPAAPASATVTAGRGNNAKITLSWTASAGATGYTIQISTDGAFAANVTTATAAANATSWSSGNLSRATAYYVRIQAFNGAGPSTWTNATPFPITTP